MTPIVCQVTCSKVNAKLLVFEKKIVRSISFYPFAVVKRRTVNASREYMALIDFHATCSQVNVTGLRCYMDEMLPIRRKTLFK